MARGGNSSLMPWIAILVIAMIIFGSLYPFNFNNRDVDVVTAFHQLSWVRANRADQLRNVLMYMPLGFALLLWLKRSLGTAWSLVLTCLAGALLSLTIEVTQVYFSRVPSYMDVMWNTTGTLL
ncbi:MAG TPA: VanZ family protein, partial [Steroidobacteraceae bacterium]|nr:VanZ family protein [Steroidobacteraceae bacterium]